MKLLPQQLLQLVCSLAAKKAAQQLEIIAGRLADPAALLTTRIALVQFLQTHRQLRWRRMTMTILRMMNKGLQWIWKNNNLSHPWSHNLSIKMTTNNVTQKNFNF